MKALYKNLISSAAGMAVCLFLAVPVSAQHQPSSGGGGGGGSHSSGGGGGGSVSTSHASSGGGGGGSFNHSSGVSGGGRSSVGVAHTSGVGGVRGGSGSYGVRGTSGVTGVTGVRGGSGGRIAPTYVYRQGAIVRNPAMVATTTVNRVGFAPRGISASPQRAGGFAAVAYRSAPRIGFGRPAGYWGRHGYYHLNKGTYTTAYAGRIGYHCQALRYGCYRFFWADMEYWYLDGFFYTYDNDQYTVVDPPVGAEVNSICDDAQAIMINGEQYYECSGVYYKKVTKDDGTVVYEVAGKDGVLNTDQQIQDDQPAGPQLGDVVTQLPSNCRKIKLNDEVIYVSPDGVYYKEIVDDKGNKTYKIVGLPTDEETPDQGTD